MKLFLSDKDRSLLDKRIAEAEKQTGAQIVLASVIRSDSYAEIPWKAFAVGASVAGLLMIILDLYVLGWQTNMLILFSIAAVLASGALLALLTVVFPGIARLFLASQRKETETMQYAQSLFLSRELFSTKDRRGILLLVSQFERQVVILPDKGLRELLGTGVLDGLIGKMIQALRRKELRDAMETGLDGIRSALSSADMKLQGTDELSNEIIEEDGV